MVEVVGGQVVKDPRTGQVFGSVEEFVFRRKGRQTFKQEFASLQRQKRQAQQERLNKALQESKDRTSKTTLDLRRQFNALNQRRDLSRNEKFRLRRDLEKQIGFVERAGRNELVNIGLGKFVEKKVSTKVPTPSTKRGASLVDVPRKLTALEKVRFSRTGQFIEEIGRKFEKRLPVVEDIVPPKKDKFGEFIEEKKVIPFAFGQGTDITTLTIRPKTFKEKFGLIETKDSNKLEKDFNRIQSDFINGKINESEANLRLDNRFIDFETQQAKKNIPKNIAISFAITALTAIPIVGPVVGVGLASNLILQRRNILKRFKDFPKASRIETASFLVGGLGGSAVGGLGKGKFVKPKITEDSLTSVTSLAGKGRTKLINQVSDIEPNFNVLRSQNKITNLVTYRVKLQDGRTFDIVEFNKLTPKDLSKGLKGDKNFIGFEVGKAPRFAERVIGKGVSVVKGPQAETFIRAVRFKPINSKVKDVFSQQLGFNKGKTIEVLSKSKIIPIGKGRFEILSESRILTIKNTQRQLNLKIRQIQNKLDRGARFSISEIKSLINLERRANRLKPFTESEFRKAGFSTVTKGEVQLLLNKVQISVQKNSKLLSKIGQVETGILSEAFTKPGKLQPGALKPFQIKKTPLTKTFAQEIKLGRKESSLVFRTKTQLGKISQRSQERSRLMTRQAQKPFSQRLKEAQSGKVSKAFGKPSKFAGLGQFELAQATTPGAIAKVLAPQIPGVSINVLTPLIIGISKLSSSERLLIRSESALKDRINQSDRTLTKLKDDLITKNKLRVKSAFDVATINNLKVQVKSAQRTAIRLRFAQKLKLSLKSKNIQSQIITSVLSPIRPFPKPKVFPTKAEIKVRRRVTPRVQRVLGYDSLVKKKKSPKFIKLNKVPLRKGQALSLSAIGVDKSIAATGKIRKSNKFAKRPIIKFDQRYFQKNRQKFRGRIIKGKQQPLKNIIIEKRKFRLDKKTETQTIQSFKKKLKTHKQPIKKTKKIKRTSFKPDKSKIKSSKLIKTRRKK